MTLLEAAEFLSEMLVKYEGKELDMTVWEDAKWEETTAVIQEERSKAR